MVAKAYITLAGKRKINLVNVESIKNTDGSFRFRGHHKISLSDYGLDPPSAFFGLIHVDDIITVQFDLLVMAKEALVQ
jgi:hypothetical protein